MYMYMICNETCVYCELHVHANYRYNIAANLGQDHFIIGKNIVDSAALSDDEISLIRSAVPNADFNRCVEYYRLLKDGVIFTSTSYQRQTATYDHVLYFSGAEIGFAVKYFSVCCIDCLSCPSPCNHLVIAEVLHTQPCRFTSDIVSGATAQHIHRVDDSRYNTHVLCTDNYTHNYTYYYSVLSNYFNFPNIGMSLEFTVRSTSVNVYILNSITAKRM